MRRFCFYVFLVSILLAFTSCGFNNSQKIIYNKSIENYENTGGINLPLDINNTKIDIMLVSDTEELSDSLVIKELSKRTGLNINIVNVPVSAASRQTQLLLSTNNLPDIMKTNLSKSEINSLGEKGTFAPVNKFLNELPNFRRVFIDNEQYNFVMDDFTASDSNLYFFPKYEYRKDITEGFLYRKDIFEKNNLKMWNNKEEFFDTLKALKELYPNSSPYVSKDEEEIYSKWSVSFGVDFPGMYYNKSEQKWKYSGCDRGFFEMLEFLKRLYTEKLIDSSFLNSSSYLWEWKVSGENGFVTYGDISSSDNAYGTVLEFANPPGDLFKIRKNPVVDIGPYIVNNDKSLLSMKLLDYLLSPSGIELSTLGVVNKTYEYSDGYVKYIDVLENETEIEKKLEEKFGLFIFDLTRKVDERSPVLRYTEKEKEILNLIKEKDGFLEESPKIKLSDSDRKRSEEIINILDSKAIEFASVYIFGGENINFDLWLSEAKKNGLGELEEIYNK